MRADQKIAFVFLILISIATISAITTNPSSVILNKENTNVQIEFQGLTNTTSLSLSSSISSYTQLNFYDVNPSEKWVTISLKSNVPVGNYIGSINYEGGSVPVAIFIESNQTQTNPSALSFPTSKTMTVLQGLESNKKVTLIVPSSYPNPINILTIEFPEENEMIRIGDIETGILNPGDLKDIPIVIDTTNAQVGTYPPMTLQLRYDDNGQVKTLSSLLYVNVKTDVNPIGSDTFSTPPTCALSGTVFGTNQTYSFTCSNYNSNIEINIPSNEYFIGKTVDITSGIYRYDFTPTKYGNTIFKAEFKYKGASVFTPYSQEIKISSSGNSVAGTNLRLSFTPNIETITNNQSVIIQLVDNKTGSLVNSPRLWINAQEINSSSESFKFNFLTNTLYELRGKANGYDDLVYSINVTRNETVVQTSIYPILNYLGSNFEKSEQSFQIDRETNWTVYFRKKLDSIDKNVFLSGNGSKILFTPNKAGVYSIEADGYTMGTYEIKGFSFSDKLWIFPIWGWAGGLLLIIIIIIIIASRSGSGGEIGGIGFMQTPINPS